VGGLNPTTSALVTPPQPPARIIQPWTIGCFGPIGALAVPAHKKTLRELVRDETFLARRHAHLLLEGPLIDDPGLRSIQERYMAETSELERWQLGLLFQKAVRDPLERVLPGPRPEDADDEHFDKGVDAKAASKPSPARKLTTAEFWYAALGPGFGDWTGVDALGFRRPDGSIDREGFDRLARRWAWWDARFGCYWRVKRRMAHNGDKLKLHRLLTGKRTLHLPTAELAMAELGEELVQRISEREPIPDPPEFELVSRRDE
jgi:hypothetical protein